MDRSKDKVGYQINFVKEFYKFKNLRSVDEIKQKLKDLDQEISKLEL